MMKTFIKDKQYGRRLLSVLSMLAVAVIAWGDNITVSMSDFSITPGETHTVAIDVTSDVRCGSAFGGIIDLPAGLTFVAVEDEELMTNNADRCSTDHKLTYATKAGNPALKDNQLKFSLLSFSGKNLKGTEGTVLSFKVKASDELAEDSKITILECQVAGSDGETSVTCKCSANVHNDAFVPTLMNLTAQPFNITPTKEYDLTFAFEKNKDVTAFQADITLPDGMSFKMIDEDEEEYVKFDASRLADHTGTANLLNGGKTLRVLLMSFENKNIKLNEGNFFTVRVKADATLAENTEMTVSKIEFAQSNGEKFNPADFTIAVSNPDIAAKADADEKIAKLKSDFESTKLDVAVVPESVQNIVKDDITILQEKIDAIDTALAQDVTNGDVAANTETREAAINEAASLIAALNTKLSDAKAAYEANEKQHTADLEAIEEVKKALETAKTEIAEMAESVQTLVAEDITAAETAVEALTTDAEASYAAGTSVADAEKLADDIEAAKAQIEALKKKATEALAAYDANEAQHTADLASIQDVQAKFDAVKDKISGYEESVRELVAEDIARIQKLIDEASAAAEKSYTEGTSVADAEVLKAQIMAIEAQITALDTKAAFEQEKAYLRGDIDETGKVDINDLAIIRDLILGKSDAEEMTEKQQQAADLNADGKYSVVDLVMLNNVIVYGNPDGPATTNAKDATLAGMESGSLTMLVEAGRMDIALNSNMPYAAIQMDITMPEGISMDDVTFAGTSEKVVIGRNMLEDGVCRILMYTTDNSAIIDRETSLLSIKLAGNGDGIVSIDNIMAATSRGEGRELAAVNGNFTIVTGINAVDTESMGEASVFDTNGIKRQTMRKGINIVRDAAGRVKKVLVK